ncbi:MAG: diaminopimelate epimerase [Nitrosomonas sp.]|nr:diaminopimelate epimerase [Nitrosomonas sp.]MBK7365708.1 diaminopimelate epimerase [Nitrosomonas sp.]
MKLKFTKMQGLGNDFVVIDAISQDISLTTTDIRFLADRHFGIGCDQVLLVEKSQSDADFRYRIFNADGNEVEQCGNGARCFVRFVHDHALTTKNEIRVETASGTIIPKLEESGDVTVNMGIPRFDPADIPFIAEKRAITYSLKINHRQIEISTVSMGNPHAVQVVPNLEQAPVLIEGPIIESHERFPKRVNVGYMQVTDRQSIKLRVFERGAGETLACGTGACAAVVTGIQRGLLDCDVEVDTRGGKLKISWAGENQPVWMTGPATTVFEGIIALPAKF